jgi:AcrR family transcriptional regulator
VTRQALRRQSRIDAILASAISVFGRHGYHGTSMDQISEQLLMTKGSLYYYFRDKEEILFAAHDRALDRINDELDQVRRGPGCPCAQVEALIAAHIRVMVEGFHGTALALEFGVLSPRRLRTVVAKRDRFEHGLRDLLAAGVRAGCYRAIDPKLAGLAILGSINWIARWYRPGGPAGADEVAARFLDLFLGGLVPGGASRTRHHRPAPVAPPRATRPPRRSPRRAAPRRIP